VYKVDARKIHCLRPASPFCIDGEIRLNPRFQNFYSPQNLLAEVYVTEIILRRSFSQVEDCLFNTLFLTRGHSVCLSVCLSVYGSTVLVDLGRFFSFLNYTLSVGLPGRGISPSQGRYLHTEQHKHRINADIHALSEIRTHDPFVWAGEDGSCLRPRGYCGRQHGVIM
jgi:hypothetical protein